VIRDDRILNVYALFANATAGTLFAIIGEATSGTIGTTTAFAVTRTAAIIA